MKIGRHQDFEVYYNEAFGVAMAVFDISKRFPTEDKYYLTDPLRRSSRSVYANIAKAFLRRKYRSSFVAKLNDAQTEAAET